MHSWSHSQDERNISHQIVLGPDSQYKAAFHLLSFHLRYVSIEHISPSRRPGERLPAAAVPPCGRSHCGSPGERGRGLHSPALSPPCPVPAQSQSGCPGSNGLPPGAAFLWEVATNSTEQHCAAWQLGTLAPYPTSWWFVSLSHFPSPPLHEKLHKRRVFASPHSRVLVLSPVSDTEQELSYTCPITRSVNPPSGKRFFWWVPQSTLHPSPTCSDPGRWVGLGGPCQWAPCSQEPGKWGWLIGCSSRRWEED